MKTFSQLLREMDEGFWDNVGKGVAAAGYGALGAISPVMGAYYGARTGWNDYNDASRTHSQDAIEALEQWKASLAKAQTPQEQQLARYLDQVLAQLKQMLATTYAQK